MEREPAIWFFSQSIDDFIAAANRTGSSLRMPITSMNMIKATTSPSFLGGRCLIRLSSVCIGYFMFPESGISKLRLGEAPLVP